MNETESMAHHLAARLRYLLMRLEAEFFHVHPDFEWNRTTKSLALSSILNEANNLQEAVFPDADKRFLDLLKRWAKTQSWEWDDVAIRFTWWPVWVDLRPFQHTPPSTLTIAGRDANNTVKHHGLLASLEDAISASAAAWFLVLERVREAGIFFHDTDTEQMMRLFDCYDLIDVQASGYGYRISRPVRNLVSYPGIRGPSEIPLAKAAFDARLSKRGKE